MTWSYETRIQRLERIQQWHTWFAWCPVFYDGKAFWLQKVRRRYVLFLLPDYGYWEFKHLEKLK